MKTATQLKRKYCTFCDYYSFTSDKPRYCNKHNITLTNPHQSKECYTHKRPKRTETDYLKDCLDRGVEY